MTTPDQQVKTYKTQNAANADIQRMAKQGYRVVSQNAASYRKAGCLAWLGFGLLNLFRKSKARDVTVIYTR
jgi:hypothetical protein